MKRSLVTAVLASLALLVSASFAGAETATWKIDPNHSEANFTVRHFFSNVVGRFNSMSGSIVLDDKDMSKSSVDAVIKTASIFTNNDRRDGHLRSADFFNADKDSQITFKSTKVIPGADKSMKIEGMLTMRGVTKPVVLDAKFLGSGSMAMGPNMTVTKSGFSATTTVNRQDYGISWNKTLDQGGTMLGDDVAIVLNIEADKVAPPGDAAAPAMPKK